MTKVKLYTEDQVIQAMKLSKNHTQFDILEKYLKPIELPSDEEIEQNYYKELEERREKAKNFTGQVAGRHPDMFGVSEIHHMVTGYLECFKWMRDKIGGNNEQQ